MANQQTSAEELFDVVDQEDRVLRQVPRSVVHANQWLHRASHIFVFNSRGELLIHRRAATKDECPRMLTSSASGHLAAGESYASAAARELEEELGLRSPLEFLTVIPANGAATSYEHSGLFRTVTDATPQFDPGEIESGEFLPLEEIQHRVSSHPEQFTPCFLTLFAWYLRFVNSQPANPSRQLSFEQSSSQQMSSQPVPVVTAATLDRITIYPLKSFAPLVLDEARVLPGGALEHDRRFALVDSAGHFINAKRTALVHSLRVLLDPFLRTLTVRGPADDVEQQWLIDADRTSIERWFSDRFLTSVQLVEDDGGGYPDDRTAPGPTVVSAATYQTVAGWFPGLTIDQVRLRFRANLEIGGVPAFWEDRLYGPGDVARTFRIGDVRLAGTNPCQRCVVPTRDPATGELWPEFAKRFSQLREAQLPDWAARDRFDHFYRLSVNTRLIAGGGSVIRVGVRIEVPEGSATADWRG